MSAEQPRSVIGVEHLSKAPAGNPIVLQFSLDLNGIMNVTAREWSARMRRRSFS